MPAGNPLAYFTPPPPGFRKPTIPFVPGQQQQKQASPQQQPLQPQGGPVGSAFAQRFPVLGAIGGGVRDWWRGLPPEAHQQIGSALAQMGASGLAASQGGDRAAVLGGMIGGFNQGMQGPEGNAEIEAILEAGQAAGVMPHLLQAAAGGNEAALNAVVDAIEAQGVPQEQEPPTVIDGIGPTGQTVKLVYDPTNENANEHGFVQMGGERIPSSWGIEVGPDGTVRVTQGAQDGGTPSQQERAAAALYPTSLADFGIVRDNFQALTSLANQAGGAIPVAGNFTVSEGYQRARSALANILQNFLVVTSGATVTEEEFNRRLDQVLPKPGDNEATIQDKLRRVEDWVTAIRNAGGRALNPELAGEPPAAEAQQDGGAEPATPVQVQTPEEAEGLAPGTLYRTPDGQIWRR